MHVAITFQEIKQEKGGSAVLHVIEMRAVLLVGPTYTWRSGLSDHPNHFNWCLSNGHQRDKTVVQSGQRSFELMRQCDWKMKLKLCQAIDEWHTSHPVPALLGVHVGLIKSSKFLI